MISGLDSLKNWRHLYLLQVSHDHQAGTEAGPPVFMREIATIETTKEYVSCPPRTSFSPPSFL